MITAKLLHPKSLKSLITQRCHGSGRADSPCHSPAAFTALHVLLIKLLKPLSVALYVAEWLNARSRADSNPPLRQWLHIEKVEH